MISAPDRRNAVELINQASTRGAGREKVCEQVGINLRTYQRWMRDTGVKVDGRPAAQCPAPANKLTQVERDAILEVCNRVAYPSLPPSQIVPRLADQCEYIASESSSYRVLREDDQLHRRGKAQALRDVPKPLGYQATAQNQVWSWDITYLAANIVGVFFRLYLVMDIFSRKIVGWEVHESETAAYVRLGN